MEVCRTSSSLRKLAIGEVSLYNVTRMTAIMLKSKGYEKLLVLGRE